MKIVRLSGFFSVVADGAVEHPHRPVLLLAAIVCRRTCRFRFRRRPPGLVPLPQRRESNAEDGYFHRPAHNPAHNQKRHRRERPGGKRRGTQFA
jgi:hypothetical protein